MTPRSRARLATAALLCALLVGSVALARADGSPNPGGKVPSTLSLSLSEPSPFTRAGRLDGQNLYTAAIRAEVTSSVVPVTLSLSEGKGETTQRIWREPVSRARAKVRLRELAPNANALRNRSKAVVVTLTAGGP